MKPTIKPPKGYRLLREGEVIRATDLCWTLGGRWGKVQDCVEFSIGCKWNHIEYMPFCRSGHTLPAAPTPAEALRWLGRQSYVFDRNTWPSGTHDLKLLKPNSCAHQLTFSGSTPLACIRKAMAAEKRGAK